jgi:hypothetical protein
MQAKACDHSKSLSEPSLHKGCSSSSSSGISGAAVIDRMAALPLAVTSCAADGTVAGGEVVTEGGAAVLEVAPELEVAAVVLGARLRAAGAAAVDAVAFRSLLASVSFVSRIFPQSAHVFLNTHWLDPLLVTFLCSHSVVDDGAAGVRGSVAGGLARGLALAFASVRRLLRVCCSSYAAPPAAPLTHPIKKSSPRNNAQSK